MIITDLPFNNHIGLQKTSSAVLLRKEDRLLNHVGTLHASAIYSLAEAASGDFIISELMPMFPNAQALAREGRIKYKRPADGDCLASVSVGKDLISEIEVTLKSKKRAKLVVSVDILCEDKVVAHASFDWWLSLS